MRATVAIALALCACASPNEPGRSSAALEATDETAPVVPVPVVPGEPEAVLDVRDDGAMLYGSVEASTAEADLDRVLVVRTELEGLPIDDELEGARVLDARFAGERIVTIGVDHVLRLHMHGEVRAIDTEANPPLSISGTRVAYTRGEMPELELARADLASGVATVLTTDMAPVWSPALSPDGSRIVFVSGATGSPRIYMLSDSSMQILPETSSFPSSPRAPRWQGDTLFFEDDHGEGASIDLRDTAS